MKDLLALTDYISTRFNQQKVILAGHSFGTYIGIQAAQQAPEKYEAYIGIGQMANTLDSELDGLKFTIDQAKLSGNTTDVEYLQGAHYPQFEEKEKFSKWMVDSFAPTE